MNDEKIRHFLCQVLQNPIPQGKIIDLCQYLSQKDWEAISSLAESHGLDTILYHRMRNLSDNCAIPDGMQEQWRQVYLKWIGRNLRILKHIERVLHALKAKGLEVIGLKGIYLFDNIYENIGLRPIADVDLLVKKKDLASVIACLQDLGYQKKVWFDPEDQNRDIMHVPQMINQHGLAIELHWTIVFDDDPFTFDINDLWQRAFPATIAGVETLALSTEDLILHLCFHTSYHHALLTGLRDLYDIREVCQKRQDAIDWSLLISTAETWGMERVIALTFSLLERVLAYKIPGPIAAHFSATVDPATLNQALNQLFYQPTTSYQIRTVHIAKFLSAKGIKDRIRLIFNRFFLPKEELSRIYDVSPNSFQIYFYYPIRFIQFIARNPNVIKGFLKTGVSRQEVNQATEEFIDHNDQLEQLRGWMAKE